MAEAEDHRALGRGGGGGPCMHVAVEAGPLKPPGPPRVERKGRVMGLPAMAAVVAHTAGRKAQQRQPGWA